MFIGEQKISRKTINLFAFGVDSCDWIKVKCIIKNHRMSISINDKIAYQNALNEDLGQIAGTRISFLGTGEIKKFEMK